ncbi:signal transduction histidine kinase [Pontibacter aydingkolensis]|uniref:Uncharacterized protein n=1 Tax=Pontibacter aydingkolensis TaxID=1911536 RepID=A0ABS7CUD1_9BACT|nr:hypothetical protein [Pontibacter aydingkolensis]MBW7467281.1 hypothetical protein [Pontibacter aydingkolensis]
MNNFVLLYHFEDQQHVQQFEQAIKKQFDKHKMEQDGPFKYFAFADVSEPGAVDKLNTVLTSMGMGREGYFGKVDYVALYFSREKDPDNIKRQLLIGTDDMVDKGAQSMATDAHRNAIQNLLAYDFRKVKR